MGRLLEVLIVAVTALLAGRLHASGLRRHYRAFFLFLLFEVSRGAALAPLNTAGFIYQKIWVLTEPLEWLFYVLVVWEIYALVLHDYRGLSTAGRWSLLVAVSIAMLAAGVSLLAPAHAPDQSRLMSYYYVTERAVYFSLAVFLLTILVLLMQYPIVLCRNIIAHSVIFCGYFVSTTFIYHLLAAGGIHVILVVRYSLDLVDLGVLAAWLLLLNRAGEQRKQQLRPSWMPGREEELVSQLNSLNFAIQSLIG
jgi:hypothetical protein